MKKERLFFLLLLALLTINAAPADRTLPDLEKAVALADFVGYVRYSDSQSTTDILVFTVMESFKGEFITLATLELPVRIDEGVDYLLVAKVKRERIVDFLYDLTSVEKLPEETTFFLNSMPCIEDAEKTPAGACHRDYSPVCGCNGVTYANTCEMRKKGVIRFKPGPCK